MTRNCIAVQAFNKVDTLTATLESLKLCVGVDRYHLIIVQDGLAGSKRADRYRAEHSQTTAMIEQWTAANRGGFASVSFQMEEMNRGTCGTTKFLIDLGFNDHERVIFTEDDVLFERDAIDWFERSFDHPAFDAPRVWAIAGESKFFDSKHQVPSAEDIAQAEVIARDQKLLNKFVYFSWLPSSCFATNLAKWGEFGVTRGGPLGDRDVNTRCRDEGKVSIWPVIARCRDVGMHHPLGYSVTLKKDTSVIPQKNSYITSAMLAPDSEELEEFVHQKGSIFKRFTGRTNAES